MALSGGRLILNTEEPIGTWSVDFGGDAMRVGGRLEGFGRIATQGAPVRFFAGSELAAAGGDLVIDGQVAGNTDVDIEANAALHARGDLGGQLTNAGTLASYRGNLIVSVETLTNTGLLTNEPGSSLFVNASTMNHTGSIVANAGAGPLFNLAASNESRIVDITGRYAPEELWDVADFVNVIVDNKHPKVMTSKKGIQY